MSIFQKFILIIVVIPLCFLCSCTKRGINLDITLSSTDKNVTDLSSEIYEESQLLEIEKFDGSIDELGAKYPIECIREIDDSYRVVYLGVDKVAVLWFDNSGKKIMGKVYSSKLSNNDFNDLKEGMSVQDVQNVDPNGEYLFLYTGRNDTPRVSYHCTKDGYLISIEYDESNTITSIQKELL